MGKSLKELFTILCEAPRVSVSPAEYRNALSGARGKVKNSGGISMDAPTQQGVKKKMEANLEVNGQGETPLSKVFKAPKITNCGPGSGRHVGVESMGAVDHHPDHPPIKNAQANWMYHAPTQTYSADRSELEHANRQDPWNRPLVMRYMKQHDDGEGEATHWTGTVQAPPAQMGTLGKAAKLQIFND